MTPYNADWLIDLDCVTRSCSRTDITTQVLRCTLVRINLAEPYYSSPAGSPSILRKFLASEQIRYFIVSEVWLFAGADKYQQSADHDHGLNSTCAADSTESRYESTNTGVIIIYTARHPFMILLIVRWFIVSFLMHIIKNWYSLIYFSFLLAQPYSVRVWLYVLRKRELTCWSIPDCSFF